MGLSSLYGSRNCHLGCPTGYQETQRIAKMCRLRSLIFLLVSYQDPLCAIIVWESMTAHRWPFFTSLARTVTVYGTLSGAAHG
jgi:hypothetical protein